MRPIEDIGTDLWLRPCRYAAPRTSHLAPAP